jgi:uncharacterized protein
MITTLEDIKNYSMKVFLNSRGSHGWDHTNRVYNMCVHIGQIEGADLDVIRIAAYLHDIGRQIQDESNGSICHAQTGAEIALKLLKHYPASNDQKSNIIHSIRSHRYRGHSKPETLEAKVLFDSDKLDSIGAIGIARAFQFAGEIGAKLYNADVELTDTRSYTEEDTAYREFKLKLSKIKDRMLTQEGQRIAVARHEFMEKFFQRFIDEINKFE